MSAKVIVMPQAKAVSDPPSEHDVAAEFTACHDYDTRFDCDRNRWFRFDGARWEEQPPGVVFSEVRDLAFAMSGGHRKACSHAFISGAEAIAKKDGAHEVRSVDWNPDPFLLGTPDGTVDLTTGKLRPSLSEDRITKLASVSPASGPPARWLAFLQQATAGDKQLIRFLQQLCGYALTGDTREHALFFIHGPGGNGKGVFLNTVTKILGDYAVTAQMDTFIASRNDRHPTELAMLQGARLVTAQETEEGRSWAESRIKQLTGGDPITARFMRQDNFTYRPRFKLVFAGNHEPVLRNVDEAMRRRFNMVPFKHKPATVDPQLEERLIEEHPQILQWMVEGCLDWLTNGLVRPAVVTQQTASYFEEQDLLGQWIEQRCETGPMFYEAAGKLFNSWKAFAHAAGDNPGKQKSFGASLRKRGFIPDQAATVDRTRIYRGVRLVTDLEHASEQGSRPASPAAYDDDERP